LVLCALACALALALAAVPSRTAHALSSDASVQAAERLREVAGSGEDVTFWSGGTPERPAYTWTFSGRELPREQAASLTSLDLGIATATDDADGNGTPDTLVLDFSHEGPLPAPALIAVAVPSGLEAEGGYALFSFDGQTGAFTEAQGGLVPVDGYVSFYLTHCSRWALSGIDLSAPVKAPLPAPAAAGAFGTVPLEAPPGQAPAPFPAARTLLPAALCLGAAALAAALAVRHRRRRELAAMQQGWAVPALAFEDIPSIGELLDIEEPGRQGR
jgi:hypothetical protein